MERINEYFEWKTDNDTPIFIIGCGRSGTTLLRLMLNKHSRIAIPEETWYFPYLYKEKERLLKSGEGDWKNRTIDFILKSTKVHFPDLKKEDLQTELNTVAPSDWPSIISIVNKSFARAENKPRWGDKTPGYVIHLPVIKKLYPDAKVIHIIRDGRDVAPSLLKHWSVGPQTNSFIETILYWKHHVRKGIIDGPILFGNNYLEIKYEALITDTKNILKQICIFLGENFEEQMLAQQERANQYVPDWDWHKNLNKPIDKTRTEIWKKDLSSYQISLFQIVAGELLQKLNYSAGKISDAKAYNEWLIYLIRSKLRQSKSLVKTKAWKIYKIIKPN